MITHELLTCFFLLSSASIAVSSKVTVCSTYEQSKIESVPKCSYQIQFYEETKYEGNTTTKKQTKRRIATNSSDILSLQQQLEEQAEAIARYAGDISSLRQEVKEQAKTIANFTDTLHRPASCNDVAGEDRVSRKYVIAPIIDPNPFTVYCNFTGEAVETIINHDSLNEKQATHGCASPRCSKNPIRYNLQLSQIIAVINQSSSCKQFVKYRCLANKFLAQKYAAWLDRNGNPQFYWGGAPSRRDGYCACGETGTCADTRYKCNCDKNSIPEASDEGYLTDKEKLPVTELQFGDLNEDASAEYGYYTVGPLICTGSSG